jgi:hypothetical protein
MAGIVISSDLSLHRCKPSRYVLSEFYTIYIRLNVLNRTMNRTVVVRRVGRYQKGIQNPYIEEEQKTLWPKDKRTEGQTTIYITYT